jgi:hypothetical protein
VERSDRPVRSPSGAQTPPSLIPGSATKARAA